MVLKLEHKQKATHRVLTKDNLSPHPFGDWRESLGGQGGHNFMLKKIHICHFWTYELFSCLKGPLSKRPKIGFQYKLSPNAGQKYCRMLQGEHSAILSTFIKLPFVIKIFVLTTFEWPLKTGFTIYYGIL